MNLKALKIMGAILTGLGLLFLIYGISWYFRVEGSYTFQGAGMNYMVAGIACLVIGIILYVTYLGKRKNT